MRAFNQTQIVAMKPSGVKIDNDRGVTLKHDVARVDIIVDDTQPMQMFQAPCNSLHPTVDLVSVSLVPLICKVYLIASGRVHSGHKRFIILCEIDSSD
ncbi:hypothetical protein N7449_008749 [Penicillium cf. viridicatum]|uniref:Uncharacterized protein n=1 Tax=Penicillium cf. viridicatum TaxID=2972119 RepID=A0A9W9MA03_9EURO|nr:hypothetical protein N7449_008749 [Penicillium cf. viridicatum]